MGVWDAGPFDNDEAADFAQELDKADPNQRLMLLRDALQAAVDGDDGAEARGVAAAAVLAATRSETALGDSEYTPDFIAEDALNPPEHLIDLAVTALDAVADAGTELSDLFDEAGTLDELRDALTS